MKFIPWIRCKLNIPYILVRQIEGYPYDWVYYCAYCGLKIHSDYHVIKGEEIQ